MKHYLKIFMFISILLLIYCQSDNQNDEGVEIESEEISENEKSTESPNSESDIKTKEMGKQMDNVIKPLINKLKEADKL